jgi:hypothetical protein
MHIMPQIGMTSAIRWYQRPGAKNEWLAIRRVHQYYNVSIGFLKAPNPPYS